MRLIASASTIGSGLPYEYPLAGTLRQTPMIESGTKFSSGGPINNGTEYKVLEIAPGNAGVVRSLFFVVDGGFFESWLRNTDLLIYYDGNGSPDVQIPLVDLYGLSALPNLLTALGDTTANRTTVRQGLWNQPFSAGRWGWSEVPYASGGAGPKLDHWSVWDRRHRPYQNGIKITLKGNGGSLQGCWYVAEYQDQLLNSAYSDMRWYAVKSQSALTTVGGVPTGTIKIDTAGNVTDGGGGSPLSGNFPGGIVGKYLYGTSWDTGVVNVFEAEILTNPSGKVLTIDPTHLGPQNASYASSFNVNPVHEFISRPANKSGFITECQAAFTGSSVFNYLEANPHFKAYGATAPFWEATGTEDFFLNSFYNEARGMPNAAAGVTFYDLTNHAVGCYRSLCLPYTAGVQGRFVGLVQPVTSCWVTEYYEHQ